METEGWLRLWRRSKEKRKFRYVTVISDGDSKAYNAVCKEKFYGEGINTEEEECLNHVEKRLGKALIQYVQTNSKGREGVGGRQYGSLTGDVIKVFQKYYRNGIHNLGHMQAMRKDMPH